MNTRSHNSGWAKLSAGSIFSGILLTVLFMTTAWAQAADAPQKNDSVQVMEAFEHQTEQAQESRSPSDQKKRLIMFSIGVPLLILLLITGALGIAMGIYGKQVFVLHMIFAGLTVTLAVVHVIVGLVWFYPF